MDNSKRMERLILETLIALRGSKSQEQLARLIQKDSTQIYRWEKGHSSITWEDFHLICKAVKAPLEEALEVVFLYKDSAINWSNFLLHITGNRSQSEIAKLANVSRSVVSRWQNNKSTPTLKAVFSLMDSSVYSFLEWLVFLTKPTVLNSIQEEIQKIQAEKKLHYQMPWVAAILLCLRTIEYRKLESHIEGYIAKKIGISLDEERAAMNSLLEVGAIFKEGSLYKPRIKKLNTAGSKEGDLKIRRYWTSRCIDYLEEHEKIQDGDSWGYKIYNTTPETVVKIRKKYLEFFQEIESLIYSESSGADQIYLMNIQFLNLNKLPIVHATESSD